MCNSSFLDFKKDHAYLILFRAPLILFVRHSYRSEKVPSLHAVVREFFINAQEEIGDVSAAVMVWGDREITAKLFIKFENPFHSTPGHQFYINNYYGEFLLKSWMVGLGKELEADEERAYARIIEFADHGEEFFVETYDMGPRKTMTAKSSPIILPVSSDTVTSVKPDAGRQKRCRVRCERTSSLLTLDNSYQK